MCCSVLQCLAVCCIVLQFVAVWFSVLQCSFFVDTYRVAPANTILEFLGLIPRKALRLSGSFAGETWHLGILLVVATLCVICAKRTLFQETPCRFWQLHTIHPYKNKSRLANNVRCVCVCVWICVCVCEFHDTWHM